MKISRFVVTILLVSSALVVTTTDAQTLTTLYAFSGPDGVEPSATLIQAGDGNFYGPTWFGGASGYGTVFRMTPTGSLTNLHSFTGPDGKWEESALVQGSDGYFYGVTFYGGNINVTNADGLGTVFRMNTSGSLTNLHSFIGSDGRLPAGALIQGQDGNFYGMTVDGGIGKGSVFRMTPNGSVSNLWSFSGGTDGAFPVGSLVQTGDGAFYGLTRSGGASHTGNVFRITQDGNLTNLYSFSGPDGALPWIGLTQGGDSYFYGTTTSGGTSNLGTVYRISSSGSLTNLYAFAGLDGANPYGRLVQGSDASFYGTTFAGGTSNHGTVFAISPSGILTSLWSFTGGPDGGNPYAGLVQGSDGAFYGATYLGGNTNFDFGQGYGTVFKLMVALSPPANQINVFQHTGVNDVLTTPSVAGETYQLQYTDDLTSGTWSNVNGASVTNSIGALLTFTNFGAAVGPRGFYRFDITP